jgi:peptidoglycan/LPS O-acetylase OafA/YrhL
VQTSQSILRRDAPAGPAALGRFLSLKLLDNRYPALHGMRVLAILSVLQIHVTYVLSGDFMGKGTGILDATLVGESYWIFFGMDMFFILSGFLIGSILHRSLQLSGVQDVRRFYVRRVFRTFPSYWVVLTLLAVSIHLTREQRHNLPLEYVYGTNFASLMPQTVVMIWGWSLALEEQFYLAVPLLLFVLYRLPRDSHRIAALSGIWCLAPAVRLAIYLRGGPWTYESLQRALYFRTYTRFDDLVLGVLLVFVYNAYGDAIRRWLEAPFHRALVGLLSLACLWLLRNPALFGVESALFVYVLSWGTITGVMYSGPLLVLLLGKSGWIPRLLSAAIFRRVATLGYGVYLVHIPVIHYGLLPIVRVLQSRGVSTGLLWCGSLFAVTVASLAIAFVLHVLVEKPALVLRDRFTGQLT